MKILELHYSTSWAGAERFVIDLSNELSKKHEVILCIIEDDSNPQKSYYLKDVSKNIKYINLKCKSGLEWKSLWRIYKTIKKEKPDIVHTHTDALAIFLSTILIKGPKYIQTLHSIANEYIAQKRLKIIYKYFYRKKILPITISNICLESYKKFYNLSNTICIDNGRSPLLPTNQAKCIKEEIESLKLHTDDKVFIHIGRYDNIKNQKLLINTFNLFLKNGNHAILLLIGAGYDCEECKSMLKNSQKGIYSLGLKNNICDYLLYSDFFLLSSLYEGLPISLLEAISYGVIPICTPTGGIPDVINNKTIGFLSKDYTEDNYYKAIMEAYQAEPHFNRELLKDYFNENFSIRQCANKYINIFQRYLKKS